VKPSGTPFRVLALDGGGIKGVFTAALLAELERMTGKRVAEHFELITGTSTGGIVAIALAVGIPAGEILRFYVEHGPEIFPSVGLHVRLRHQIRWMLSGKHDARPLKQALASVFGSRRIGEARTRLVVPAFNVVDGSIMLFKTAHCARFRQDYLRSCIDVALATSAAPTFLPAHDIGDGRVYLDGGLWANNPILVGVLDAIVNCGQQANDVDVLNIGTTEEAFHVPEELRRRGGALKWISRLASLFMQAQSDAVLKQATILLERKPYRISPSVRPSRFRLDDARRISDLQALGIDCARHHEQYVSPRFLTQQAEPLVPFHSLISAVEAQTPTVALTQPEG
jgi:predicted acylesterase/phospholipase RssA